MGKDQNSGRPTWLRIGIFISVGIVSLYLAAVSDWGAGYKVVVLAVSGASLLEPIVCFGRDTALRGGFVNP